MVAIFVVVVKVFIVRVSGQILDLNVEFSVCVSELQDVAEAFYSRG